MTDLSRRDSNGDMTKKASLPVTNNSEGKKLATHKILSNKIASKDGMSMKSKESIIVRKESRKSLVHSSSPRISETQ